MLKTHRMFIHGSRVGSLVAVVLLILGSLAAGLRADDKKAPEAALLEKQLVGTWVLVGEPGKVGEIPKAGGRLKFFTGKHWNITQADPDTGEVIFHHGGTYTLKDDEMEETIEYANKSTAELLKKTHKFKIKIEDDTYTQVGIGNPYSEVWKRMK